MSSRWAAAELAALAGFCGVACLLGCTQARATPADDPLSTWTVQDENSSVALSSLSDKYYVNGLSLSWTSPTDAAPHVLSDIDAIKQFWPVILGLVLLTVVMFQPKGILGVFVSDRERIGGYGRRRRGG